MMIVRRKKQKGDEITLRKAGPFREYGKEAVFKWEVLKDQECAYQARPGKIQQKVSLCCQRLGLDLTIKKYSNLKIFSMLDLISRIKLI